jgi:hypothetical protein
MIRGNSLDKEIIEECGHWIPWVSLVFMTCINTRYGFFEHLPFSGAVMDQPVFVMMVLTIMKSEFLTHLQELNKQNPQMD